MQCPICGSRADDVTPLGYDGIGVRCRNCGEFDVADSTLNELLRRHIAERVDALARAKERALTGERPTITARCL
jgi:hypothetical protein